MVWRRVVSAGIPLIDLGLISRFLARLDLIVRLPRRLRPLGLRLRLGRAGVARGAAGVLHLRALLLIGRIVVRIGVAVLGRRRRVPLIWLLGVGRTGRLLLALGPGLVGEQSLLLKALGQLAKLGVVGRRLLVPGGVLLVLIPRVAGRSLVGACLLAVRSRLLLRLVVIASRAAVFVVLVA